MFSKIKSIILILLLMSLITGCSSQNEEVIKIGALLSLTGPAAQYGEAALNGMNLAVDTINADGGINGKEVVLVVEDDGTDATNAVTAFEKLTSVDGVTAIIGGMWDFNYNAIASLAETNQITLITPQNVKTDGLIVNDYTFVMHPEMKKITATLKEYLESQEVKKAAIVRFSSDFGKDIAVGLEDMMDDLQGELVLDEKYVAIGGNEFLTVILKVKEADPDVVFIDMVGNDIAAFMKRVQENDLDVQVLGHGGVSDYLDNPNVDHELVEGVIYFDYGLPSSPEFIELYTEHYNKKPTHSADGSYDAMMALAQALGNAEDHSLIHTYLEEETFASVNGEFSFKDHVVDSREVLIQKVTADGIETLATKQVKT